MKHLLEEVGAPAAIPFGANLNIKKILVAVDLSPHSEQTAAYAAEFAARFGASVTLIHVSSPKETAELTGVKDCRFDNTVIAPEKKLEDLAKKIRKIYPTCSAHLFVGDPAEKVVMMAEMLRADLILTGSRHPRFLGQLLGDQPSRIVHRAPCPVLVYHDGN